SAVPDPAAAYAASQAYDPRDPASVNRPPELMSAGSHRGVEGLRIARLVGYFSSHAGPEARAAVDAACAHLGVEQEVELPDAALGRAAAFVISACEGGNLHLDDLR